MNETNDEMVPEVTENIDSEIDESAEMQVDAQMVADENEDSISEIKADEVAEEVVNEELVSEADSTPIEASQPEIGDDSPDEEISASEPEIVDSDPIDETAVPESDNDDKEEQSDAELPIMEVETAISEEVPESEASEVVDETSVLATAESDSPNSESGDEEQPPIAKEIIDDSPKPQAEAMSYPAEEILAEVEEEPAPPPPVDHEDGREWYVVHCYSGYENKVRHNLEQRIESMGMKNLIFDVVVPTEEEIEVKDGKRRTVERRVFPGYILVNMILGEESWYVVRNTPGVTSFVGMGEEPIPLRPEEVSQIIKRMESDAPRIKVTFKPGERVRIVDGPFNDFRGTVDVIDMERAKVRVMVNFFGRETPVELDFLQVEKS